MPIRNKDGSSFRLTSPNPLGRSQEVIDLSRAIFHNFKWQEVKSDTEIIIPEPTPVVEIKPEPEIIKDIQQFFTIEPEPVVEPTVVEVKAEAPPPRFKRQVLFHCLPANFVSYQDDLYGDRYRKIEYSKKFVFPGIVIDSSDFMLHFWTTDPNRQITENSIIYPFAYEIQDNGRSHRVPYDEYRWWKVSGSEERDGGFLFEATPSPVQPDFSD